jgi:hypothetical protein
MNKHVEVKIMQRYLIVFLFLGLGTCGYGMQQAPEAMLPEIVFIGQANFATRQLVPVHKADDGVIQEDIGVVRLAPCRIHDIGSKEIKQRRRQARARAEEITQRLEVRQERIERMQRARHEIEKLYNNDYLRGEWFKPLVVYYFRSGYALPDDSLKQLRKRGLIGPKDVHKILRLVDVARALDAFCRQRNVLVHLLPFQPIRHI